MYNPFVEQSILIDLGRINHMANSCRIRSSRDYNPLAPLRKPKSPKWKLDSLEALIYEIWMLSGHEGINVVFRPLFRKMISWAGTVYAAELELQLKA